MLAASSLRPACSSLRGIKRIPNQFSIDKYEFPFEIECTQNGSFRKVFVFAQRGEALFGLQYTTESTVLFIVALFFKF